MAVWAFIVLEGARRGVEVASITLGDTPVTRLTTGGGGPAVVVAHGFAGSRQIMQGYSFFLARAGYDVYAFDFEGHGMHPVPMSGDVSSIEGTTRKLVNQTRAVIDLAAQGGTPVALLGHSMATDILVRAAEDDARIGPLVLISAFSAAIDAAHPRDALFVTGAWEPGLADFAVDAARMVDPAAAPGQTVTEGGVSRRAVIVPLADHVAILHARAARAEALAWLNRFYARTPASEPPQTGWALLALLAAITALARPLARLLPTRVTTPPSLTRAQIVAVLLVPGVAAPLLAAPFDLAFLPVLVADYLALHLLIYGAVHLGLLLWFGARPGWPAPFAAALLLVWGLAVFGLVLDRYGANFWPVSPRVPIISALVVGAVPFMMADALAAYCAPIWRRVLQRIVFLASLGAAVALDFEGLFFLFMIAPVIVLFWLTFGLMGRAFAQRAGPATAGLPLGVILAWALGVTFPLFTI
ncbi:MAG: alpha/beta fold hydrolase [Pseudomonadota bacterium]